jgi:hypothetical protein
VNKVKEKTMAESKNRTENFLPHEYGCQILFENATMHQAKDKTLPSDAYLIWYKVDEKVFMDVTRCKKRVDLFDFYYDKFGPGSVQKIDFGYGRVNPKLWGYKQPEKKKRK